MLAGLNRIVLLALCVLPALAFGARTGSLPVATYISSCGGSGQSPSVRTFYTIEHRPTARPKSAPVELFAGAAKPGREYEQVGVVHVVARMSGTSSEELTGLAQQAARQMGGDALVSVQIDDAASIRPPIGNVGTLGLAASVVRWSDRPSGLPY